MLYFEQQPHFLLLLLLFVSRLTHTFICLLLTLPIEILYFKNEVEHHLLIVFYVWFLLAVHKEKLYS